MHLKFARQSPAILVVFNAFVSISRLSEPLVVEGVGQIGQVEEVGEVEGGGRWDRSLCKASTAACIPVSQ